MLPNDLFEHSDNESEPEINNFRILYETIVNNFQEIKDNIPPDLSEVESILGNINSKIDDLQVAIQEKNVFYDFCVVMNDICNWFVEKYNSWFPKPPILHNFPPSVFDRLPEKEYVWSWSLNWPTRFPIYKNWLGW